VAVSATCGGHVIWDCDYVSVNHVISLCLCDHAIFVCGLGVCEIEQPTCVLSICVCVCMCAYLSCDQL